MTKSENTAPSLRPKKIDSGEGAFFPQLVKRVAVLLDGGHVRFQLRSLLKRYPTAEEIVEFAKECVHGSEEDLFRIYYYDCPPFTGVLTNPISGQQSNSTGARLGTKFHDKLRVSDHVAYRGGELLCHGWVVSEVATQQLINRDRRLQAKDLQPNLKQKRVDIKIGLDIAWLASKSIVDRLILVTADSDFVPAMKFARREGVQIIVVNMGRGLRQELKEHADEVRLVSFQQ